jgi:outer membrane protein assembly factor BamD (BamD/ComL family)
LSELGTMYFRSGRPDDAIVLIEELMERFPDEPGLDVLRYRLADSYRLSAAKAEKSMSEGMPEEARQTLEKTRISRLNRAAELFEQVRRSLESKPADKRSVVEETYLRNSYFYVGDCAFSLGDDDGAIRFYTAARDRYPTDPASLVAMIQIVNANLKRGDLKAAMTANERAKRFYKGLPGDVWKDPNLPMSREDWERWLDSTEKLAGGEPLDRERPE